MLHKTTKRILKFTWKHKIYRVARAVLNKKTKTRGIVIPNFKLNYEAILTKQHGTDTKINTQINVTENKKQIYTTTAIWFFTKEPKSYAEKREQL